MHIRKKAILGTIAVGITMTAAALLGGGYAFAAAHPDTVRITEVPADNWTPHGTAHSWADREITAAPADRDI